MNSFQIERQPDGNYKVSETMIHRGTMNFMSWERLIRDHLGSVVCRPDEVLAGFQVGADGLQFRFEKIPARNNLFLKIGGKTFFCTECGSNMFSGTAPKKYTCQGCGADYDGEAEEKQAA